MARQMFLPSDPKYLLQYMDDLDSDSSDEEFDGYIEDDEETIRRRDEDLHCGNEVNGVRDEQMTGWTVMMDWLTLEIKGGLMTWWERRRREKWRKGVTLGKGEKTSKGKLKEVAVVVKVTVTVMQILKMPAMEFHSLLRMLEWFQI